MKIIIRINRGEDTSKHMLEFTGLCIIRKELAYNSGSVYGYAVVLCYHDDSKTYYKKVSARYIYEFFRKEAFIWKAKS